MESLKSTVQAEIAAEKVLVYSKSYCPFAGRAKDLLRSNGVDAKIVELDQVSNGADIQNALKSITGQGTVPNIFIGGKHIGGCDSIMALNSSGKIGAALTAAGAAHNF